MFRHLSVIAENPKSVADFFAQLMGGVAIDLPSSVGGYLALAPDGRGGAVGVYPVGSAIAAETEATFTIRAAVSAEQVEALAAARGWGCFASDDGARASLIEVWVEDSWLVEVSAAKARAGFASAAA